MHGSAPPACCMKHRSALPSGCWTERSINTKSHPSQDTSITDVPLVAAAHAISPRAQPTPAPRPCAADPASRVAKMKLCRRLEGVYHAIC